MQIGADQLAGSRSCRNSMKRVPALAAMAWPAEVVA